jgi:hypothetical protein
MTQIAMREKYSSRGLKLRYLSAFHHALFLTERCFFCKYLRACILAGIFSWLLSKVLPLSLSVKCNLRVPLVLVFLHF